MDEPPNQPRLAILINSLAGGGAERVAVNLSGVLANRDWDVTIITLEHEETDFYATPPSVARASLDLLSGRYRNRRPARMLRGAIQALAILRLRSTVKRHRPDVVLSFLTKMNVTATAFMFRSGIPLVVSEQNHPPLAEVGRIWHLLRRHIYAHSSAVLALTTESADWLRRHTKAGAVTVIPNPVTHPMPLGEPAVAPSQVTSLLTGKFTLLAVGRLVRQKGFIRLIRAFAECADGARDWHLVILGEGPLREDLERLVEHLGLNASVAMPGLVGNLADWYEEADLFVMTSLWEGFGNVLAEALAHGCPAVAVDCDTGPRDILRHGVDGLLVPQNDYRALVQALSLMMREPDLRQRFASRAVDARERFASDRIATMYEDIFNELISRSRHVRGLDSLSE